MNRQDRETTPAQSASWPPRPALLDLDPSGRVLEASADALAMLGCEDASGAAALLASSAPEFREVIDRLRVPGSSASVSFALTLENGSARSFRLDVVRLGSPARFVGVVSDLALRDAIEGDVRLAAQLRELSKSYRTIAHELRAPLSAMLVNLDMLHESLDGQWRLDTGGRERQLACVKVLRGEMSRLNRSLHDLLTDAGSHLERFEPFDLREIVRDLALLISAQARRQGVDVTTGLPVEPPILLGHRDRLKEAFLNVIVNALQAMPDGGRLIIHVEREDGRARVVFRDTGPGFSPEIVGRLGGAPVSTKVGGSGIGLYVARRLVELNNGRLRIVPNQPGGAVVEVELPLAPATH